MNEIGYALQQLWFGTVRRGRRRERPFLAPESIAVADFRNTKWLQGLVARRSSPADALIEMLIFGLIGLAMAHHLMDMSEDLVGLLILFFSLFAF